MTKSNNITKGRLYEYNLRQKNLLLWTLLHNKLIELEKLSKKINVSDEKEKIRLWNDFHRYYNKFPIKNCNNTKMKSIYFSVFGSLKQALKKQYFDETNFKYTLKLNIDRLSYRINKLKNNL